MSKKYFNGWILLTNIYDKFLFNEEMKDSVKGKRLFSHQSFLIFNI